MSAIPETAIPVDRICIPVMEAYYHCAAFEKADALALSIMKNTLAMDLTLRNWAHLPEQEPSDLKERVAKRLLDTLSQEKRNKAHKELQGIAREAGIRY